MERQLSGIREKIIKLKAELNIRKRDKQRELKALDNEFNVSSLNEAVKLKASLEDQIKQSQEKYETLLKKASRMIAKYERH